MGNKRNYSKLIRQYPKEISKEQFWKICHISKHKAKYLLDSGLVPCVNNGKGTHKYVIAMKDVVAYLKQSEADPIRFTVPSKTPKRQNQALKRLLVLPNAIEAMTRQYSTQLEPYPDLLTVKDVTRLTGYCDSVINRWCVNQYVFHFLVHRKYLIPKESFLEFMLSDHFRNICTKSLKHQEMLEQVLAELEHKEVKKNERQPKKRKTGFSG